MHDGAVSSNSWEEKHRQEVYRTVMDGLLELNGATENKGVDVSAKRGELHEDAEYLTDRILEQERESLRFKGLNRHAGAVFEINQLDGQERLF